MAENNTGQFAVVTGASSGIGYELAKQFATNGFDLLIVSETNKIEEAGRSLSNLGAKVQTLTANLATDEGVNQLYSAIQQGGRPLDAIAINAGVGAGGDFVRDTDLKDELNIIDLNVRGVVHLTKHVLRDMVARGSGRILFTSSIAGDMPAPFEAVYGASKAFVTSFGQAIRNETKDTGVTITLLMPGATETNFFERADMMDTKLGQSEKDDPAQVAKQGFDALMAGKDHIVAGSLKNNLQSAAGDVLPDTVVANMHRTQSAPGSGR